jgi:hypothetical protein
MVTRATVFKEPGATPAQATTHVRPRTADRHHDVLPHLRPRANNPALPGLPPLFHTVYTPFHTKWYEFFACFFLMHAFMTDPGNMVSCTRQPCARDPCNRAAASAHGMGSGVLAVDAVAIGCLGAERRGFALGLCDFVSV